MFVWNIEFLSLLSADKFAVGKFQMRKKKTQQYIKIAWFLPFSWFTETPAFTLIGRTLGLIRRIWKEKAKNNEMCFSDSFDLFKSLPILGF